MKYMTFNGSGGLAGVANLLEDYDIDVEDRELAREMELGYIFKYDLDKDLYLSGPRLQNKRYFDYYLNPKGLELIEQRIDKEGFVDFLRHFKRRCMVRVNLDGSRYTIVFEEYNLARETYVFSNSKKENSKAGLILAFDRYKLLEVLDDQVEFSYISYKKGDYLVDLDEDIRRTPDILDRYYRDVEEYMLSERDRESLASSSENLFRALLLDVATMMEILGEEELEEDLASLRGDHQRALALGRDLSLADHMSLEDYRSAVEDYKKIVQERIDRLLI